MSSESHHHEPLPDGKPAARRVLIIDPHADAGESLALLLQLWGHETQTARTVSEGLQTLERFSPDVVFTDFLEPGDDGMETPARIRTHAHRPDLPVVALTSRADEVSRRRVQAAGFTAYIIKPVDPDRLAALLPRPSHGAVEPNQPIPDTERGPDAAQDGLAQLVQWTPAFDLRTAPRSSPPLRTDTPPPAEARFRYSPSRSSLGELSVRYFRPTIGSVGVLTDGLSRRSRPY